MALLSPKNSFLVSTLLSFLLFSSLVFASNNTQQCIQDHFSALLHLKHGFHFSKHNTNLSSWIPGNKNCSSWEGVTCDVTTGHVISLDLGARWILGVVNFESLFRLHTLQRLNLADNDFDPSPFPSGFGQLTSLTHLDLSRLNLYGQIPLEISHLTSLVSLNLSLNDLKLENPNMGALLQNLSSLKELRLNYINISAQGSEWGQALSSALPRLRKLSLRSCGLSGPIHSSLSQLHFLSELDLGYNNLSSAVPNFFANFSSLTYLSLGKCDLHGKFPENIFRLPNLQILQLYDNPFLMGHFPEFPQNNTIYQLLMSDTGFSGKLPDMLGNLKFLSTLDLRNCNLSGSLPSSLVNLTNLIYLDLSFNRFNGNIPLSLLSLPSLWKLYLGSNQLGGKLGDFHNASSSLLDFIYLDDNNLQGPIPKSVFEFTKLQVLSLSSNNFSGVLELGLVQSLKNIEYLDLSENSLSIADGSDNSTFVSFPQIGYLSLRSCNIRRFPNILRTQKLLYHLDLSNNRITGEIPRWIWQVGPLVYLNLSHNALLGIPHLLLTDLVYLDLSSNMLEGPLLIPLPFTLFFSLSNNSFSGELPMSICNAKSLAVLDLSENHLHGWIPQCLGQISDTLVVLNLRGNAFHGTVLQTFKEGCNMQTLDLSGNQLEGPLPKSLANCKMLEVLNLGKNQINDTFPLWIESLSQLRILILRSNKFYGIIAHPLTDQSLPLLQIIDLSFNSFTGSLPSNIFWRWKAMMVVDESESKLVHRIINSQVYYQDTVTVTSKGLEMKLVKILTIFTAVDLSNNYFQGNIPEAIGILKSLHVLNLSHNCFTGRIPLSFENLTELESLDLSQNTISGEIPWQLTKLTFLSVLNFSENLLMGSIPQSRQFLTFTNESFQGNVGLCGPPLSRKCIEPSSVVQTVKDAPLQLDWEFMWIGFGVGYGTGMGIYFWIIALWRKGSSECNKFIDQMLLMIFPSTMFAQKRQRRRR